MKRPTIVLAGLLLLGAPAAKAAFVPFGVQNDVSVNTVLNTWGWTVAYQGTYGQMGQSISSVFANATGPYVMFAARRVGSTTFDVLGAALKTDVTTYTGLNQTTLSNGVRWYFNAYSMGFAGGSDQIYQDSADGWDVFGPGSGGPIERDRLSWHTSLSGFYGNQTPNAPPNFMDGGWRSGNNYGLNTDNGWERFVLTGGIAPDPVPLPASAVPMALGLAGLAFAAFVRRMLIA